MIKELEERKKYAMLKVIFNSQASFGRDSLIAYLDIVFKVEKAVQYLNPEQINQYFRFLQDEEPEIEPEAQPH
jgi:hypothetical protein